MPIFRKKPIIIEAFRYGTNLFPDWMYKRKDWKAIQGKEYEHLIIETLEGEMRADIGDYIIKGVKDEIYPCKSDIFEATYEPVSDL